KSKGKAIPAGRILLRRKTPREGSNLNLFREPLGVSMTTLIVPSPSVGGRAAHPAGCRGWRFMAERRSVLSSGPIGGGGMRSGQRPQEHRSGQDGRLVAREVDRWPHGRR